MLQFLNPALLFGAALFSVPLIIHLLNRQRYKRREWAAMEFLLLAYKKNRRRLRTENLILLLLRCLIPIVLALAIARPLLRDVSGVAGLGGTAHHVIVLDQSYSMALQPEGAPSAFRRMKDLAAQLLDRLERRSGQKVSLVLSGVRPSIPQQDQLNLPLVKEVLAKVRGSVDAAADLTAAMLQVADLVEDATDSELRVYVFTDLQARAFGELRDDDAAPPGAPGEPPRQPPAGGPEADDPAVAEDAFRDTIRDAFDRIAKRAEITILDICGLASESGATRADNLQITNVESGHAQAIARVATPIVVTLRNRADTTRSLQVTLEVEGGAPTRQTIELAAGAEGQLEFPVTFRTAGLHYVRASSETNDGLAADDERFLVVQVRDRIRLLLVEGYEDETDPALMASEHIRAILDPTRGEGGPEVTLFAPKVISPTEFLTRRENLQDYDLIVLANVERLDESSANAIKEAMQAGTSLLVTFGENVDLQSYNLHLHDVGAGPLPVQLTTIGGYQPGGDRSLGSVITDRDHPVFAGFDQNVYRDIFEQTPVYRYVRSTNENSESTVVLARLRDDAQSPLVVASTFGNAKALFMLSTLDARPGKWNEFDWLGLSMPLIHEAVNWLTKPDEDAFNVLCGATLTGALDQRPSDVAIVPPERAGSGKVPVGEDSRALPGGRFSLPRYTDTEFAGIYSMEMSVESNGNQERKTLPFAVNVDPAEGDLSYLSYAAVREQLGVQRVLRALPSEGAVSIESGTSELGVPFLFLALLLLVGEAGMARFVSRRR